MLICSSLSYQYRQLHTRHLLLSTDSCDPRGQVFPLHSPLRVQQWRFSVKLTPSGHMIFAMRSAPNLAKVSTGVLRRKPLAWQQGRSSADEDEHFCRNPVATPRTQPHHSASPGSPGVPGHSVATNVRHRGSLAGFRTVDCPLRFRMEEAFSTDSDDAQNWKTLVILASHSSQTNVLLSLFTTDVWFWSAHGM